MGEEVQFAPKVYWTQYSVADYKTCNFPKFTGFKLELAANHTYWLNVDGIHEPKVIETVGKIFDSHPLVMEDILNT